MTGLTPDEEAAMERLRRDSALASPGSRLQRDSSVLLAALERAMPLLPLVDVIEKLEAVPEWSIKLQKFKLLGGIVGHLEIGPNKRLVAEDTWPDAIRALKQAVESEAKS